MAEGDVIIEGLGPGVPQWSTEKTLAEIKAILAKENMLTSDVSKRIDNVAKGNAETVKVLRETVANERANQKATQKLTELTKSQIQEEKTSRGIFGNIYKGIQDLVRQEKLSDELQAKRNKILEDKLTQSYEKLGVDPQNARIKAKFEMVSKGTQDTGTFGDPFQKTIKGLMGLTVAAEGFDAFLGQAFEDRFNLTNQIRQTGLFAGLDTASSGLVQFSQKIRDNNFTLGQAAEFTKQFSRAVGITGVEAALEFVNSMAYDRTLEDGKTALGMMKRFGMDFRQVTLVSGEFLDSLKSANLLGKLNERQMRQGMEDFMEGVTATSNVLKISLEDSAKMIADRLNRDDISAFLALMDPEKRKTATTALANVGLEDGSALGEAIMKRIAMGSQGFLVSDQRAELMQTGQGAQLVNLIEQVGMVADRGGDVQGAMVEFMKGASQMVEAQQGSASAGLLIKDNVGNLMKIIPEIQRYTQTIADIDKGITAPGEQDLAQVAKDDLQRKSVVAVEGLVNTQMEAFGSNLQNFNVQTERMQENIQKIGDDLAPAAAAVTRGAGLISEGTRALANSILDGAGLITSVINSATTSISESRIVKRSKVGQQINNAGEVLTEEVIEGNNKSMQTGKDLLQDGGVGSFIMDSDAANMYDEIISVLRQPQGTDITGEAKDLASLIGFGKYKDTFGANQEALLQAIAAIKTTDEFKSEGSQEKLAKLVEEITKLNATFVTTNRRTSQSKADAINNENTSDKDKLISTMEELIREIRNQ